jgi:hypothetical protein
VQAVNFVGTGYLQMLESGFDAAKFAPMTDDPDRAIKERFLVAMKRIMAIYHDRMPLFFYETLAFMGTRPEPSREVRVPDIESILPSSMNWKQADTVLHAMPLCSRLNLDVLSHIWEETGCIIVHGCGCNHAVPDPIDGQTVRSFLRKEPQAIIDESESFVRHALAQYIALLAGFPQGFGVSNRARDVARASESFVVKYVLRPAHFYSSKESVNV